MTLVNFNRKYMTRRFKKQMKIEKGSYSKVKALKKILGCI